MDLNAWAQRKREAARSLTQLDIRSITPSLKELTHAVTNHRTSLSVVVELARQTPEEGPLCDDYLPAELAAACDEAEVAALAVATDDVVCRGSERDLAEVARASATPVLMRDLIVTGEQVYRARLCGADAVLLTASVLHPGELKACVQISASMHMAPVVEVVSEQELDVAVQSGARIAVVPAFDGPRLDLSLAKRLLPVFPRTLVPVVRGPFARPEDLAELRGLADAVWLCGPLMRAKNVLEFLKPLVEAANA